MRRRRNEAPSWIIRKNGLRAQSSFAVGSDSRANDSSIPPASRAQRSPRLS